MTLSRRKFLGSSAAIPLAAAAAAAANSAISPRPAAACGAGVGLAPLEVIALNRMAFGPRPGDLEAFRALGANPDAQLAAYVEQQLNPAAIDDTACEQRLASVRLKLRYGAVNQVLPLQHLGQQVPELWPLSKFDRPFEFAQRARPADEVRVATWIRAVYSKRQLLEVMVDFWHNHFNVSTASDSAVMVTMPVYDRDVIRRHALGNFRAFVEEVAKSTAMLYYLDNVSNRVAGLEGGNENYARELFELHTLGSDNYLKFYDDRRQIGTVTYGDETFAKGYIDDDVYEASYCLTGWTVRNGHWEFPKEPAYDTGEFFFYPNWHQPGTKRVLTVDGYDVIANKLNPLAEAEAVFDRVAYHPGTARHLCTKLCRRLIGDDPPQAAIDAAVATWMEHRRSPDQIRHVLRTILLSASFKTTWGQKMKRPLEAVWSFLRATGAELPSDEVLPNADEGNHWARLFWNMSNSGQRLFEWPTPTGHPDRASHWANTNALIHRWNAPYRITQGGGGNVRMDLLGQTNMAGSCVAIVDFWVGRLCGYPISSTTRDALVSFMAQGGDPNQPPRPTAQAPDWNDPKALGDRLLAMVQLLAMSPEFQLR